jgi:hypothetical protein
MASALSACLKEIFLTSSSSVSCSYHRKIERKVFFTLLLMIAIFNLLDCKVSSCTDCANYNTQKLASHEILNSKELQFLSLHNFLV